ncbi:MAG: family 16 glycoside hydrolase [Planctomycetota bacterium]
MRIQTPLIVALGCLIAANAFADPNSNELSKPEVLSGWELLFDGTSTDKWRNYKQEAVSEGWKVEDGAISRIGNKAGDIITKAKYKYFELSLEYKISKGGNSGIMFHVTEEFNKSYQSGPEIQVQDNVSGHDPQKAGWLYQMYQPIGGLDATRPVGEWNQVFLRIHPQQCEVSMNGNLYYRFKLGSKDWARRLAKSKFAKWQGFGEAGEGHICLQDHGNLVSYRNIKVRRLSDSGAAAQPITGKLEMAGEVAFPNLKWDGWSAIDENDKVRPLRIMELTYAKGDGNRLFAAAQNGAIFSFENKPDVSESKLVLDLRDTVTQWNTRGANEEGLLGLAMHPKFTENGQFIVYYTHKDNHRSVISRFAMKDGKVDRSAEEVLLEIPQPFQNHNGGSIEFGPDGYLYVGTGDGGLRNDPQINGQNVTSLLGKVLRIDIDGDSAGKYGIPADNPFVDVEGARGEVFAFGLRNPWRIAFDKASGRLWAGDVGQELWEEVNVIEKGGNYGWSRREGDFPFGNKEQPSLVSEPIGPVWAYDHLAGKSITGGRVYNSDRIAALKGKYIYADYVTGAIWALSYDADAGQATANEQVVAGGVPVLAFGEDQKGEIYYTLANPKDQIYRFKK